MRRVVHGMIAGVGALLVLATSVLADDWTSVYYAQQKLQSLGYEGVKPDGRSGPVTRRALAEAADKYEFEPTISGLFEHFAAETVRRSVPIENSAQMAAIETAVKYDLMDPFSAHLRQVRRHESGMVCGEVNSKNQFGAYVGWRRFMVPLVFPLQNRPGEWYAVSASIDGPGDVHVAMTCMLDIAFRLPPDEQKGLDELILRGKDAE